MGQMKFWFANLQSVRKDGSTVSIMPFREEASRFPTMADFGEWCWAQAIKRGYPRHTKEYQLVISHDKPVMVPTKRTLTKRGKTL
jgi:hypothetical protein